MPAGSECSACPMADDWTRLGLADDLSAITLNDTRRNVQGRGTGPQFGCTAVVPDVVLRLLASTAHGGTVHHPATPSPSSSSMSAATASRPLSWSAARSSSARRASSRVHPHSRSTPTSPVDRRRIRDGGALRGRVFVDQMLIDHHVRQGRRGEDGEVGRKIHEGPGARRVHDDLRAPLMAWR